MDINQWENKEEKRGKEREDDDDDNDDKNNIFSLSINLEKKTKYSCNRMGGIDQRKQKLNLKPILFFELFGVCMCVSTYMYVLIQIISRRRHQRREITVVSVQTEV